MRSRPALLSLARHRFRDAQSAYGSGNVIEGPFNGALLALRNALGMLEELLDGLV
ncbi:MAG TPA: hypothetical protein VD962_05300 [Rubricoccaceae bacterium]|nr:hypothetical protein [Rubricoccaceae bacterium]